MPISKDEIEHSQNNRKTKQESEVYTNRCSVVQTIERALCVLLTQ
eukprot:IDg884t1